MYISYIKIRNFRNFRCIELDLKQNTVIVGENTSGKSNFLEAIRLVLDPSLSDRERQLTGEDFWAGDPESTPAYKGTTIEIIIGITDLDKILLSFLHDSTSPDKPAETAYIAYRFEPNPTLDIDIDKIVPSQYTFNFYRPKSKPLLHSEETVDDWNKQYCPLKNLTEIRKRLVFQMIPALRDIEGSIESWRRSPLKNLVERLKLEEEPKFSEAVGQLKEAAETLRIAESVKGLENSIQSRLQRMLGGIHNIEPRLNFMTLDESILSRSLRLFLDGENWRPIGSASLGVANILHLALLTLDSEKRRSEDNEFIILAVEEPEAHLHPHLQRLIFRHYFELAISYNQPTLVTTHSPHITSVAPLDSIVLIKTDGQESHAKSTATSLNDLSTKEKNDLTRYLDTTRSELLFAKGVILVEGPTELFLIPAFVEHMTNLMPMSAKIGHSSENSQGPPMSLDQFSITICNIHSVGFKPYVKLLKALDIPMVVLTDGDRRYDKESRQYKYPGLQRGISIIRCFDRNKARYLKNLFEDQQQHSELRDKLAEDGIFVNDQTFEAELLLAGNSNLFLEIFKDLGLGEELQKELKERMKSYVDKGGKGKDANDALKEVLKRIERHPCHGKGRFAQDLSERIDQNTMMPDYLSKAIRYIVDIVTRN